MTKTKLEYRWSFDGDKYIFGEHLSKEEAIKFMQEEDELLYYQEVKGIEHEWVTFGMIPENVREEEGQHGWWVINNPESYKRKKKVTQVIIGNKEGVPKECPKCTSNRIWLEDGYGNASCNMCSHKWQYIKP
jgi:hypothetical protein